MKRLLLILIFCLGSPAIAGPVQGTVELPAPPEPEVSVNLYSKYEAKAGPPAPRRPGVVALVPLSGQAPPAPQDTPVMDQKDLQFKPHVLPIQKGTTVRFTNSDKYFHNVFSLSKVKRFDLGRYPKGDFEVVEFDQLGVVPLFCDIHASMSAFILVLDTPYFTVTDAAGGYRIEDVPAGRYTMLVWHETMQEPQDYGTLDVLPEGTTEPGPRGIAVR